MGNVPICDGYINAEKNIEVWLFQQDRPHSARLTKAWFRSERMQVLDGPDLPPFEQLLQLKSYLSRNGSELNCQTKVFSFQILTECC